MKHRPLAAREESSSPVDFPSRRRGTWYGLAGHLRSSDVVRLWNTDRSGEALTFDHPTGARQIAFSADGRQLITLHGATARFTPCDVCGPINEVLTLAGQRTTRDFTPEERAKYLRNDTAVLAGMTRALHKRGVDVVGVYSTGHQWDRITGGASLDRAPVWYAGVGSAATARSRCKPAWSFTGGRVRMTQFLAPSGLDGDLRC